MNIFKRFLVLSLAVSLFLGGFVPSAKADIALEDDGQLILDAIFNLGSSDRGLATLRYRINDPSDNLNGTYWFRVDSSPESENSVEDNLIVGSQGDNTFSVDYDQPNGTVTEVPISISDMGVSTLQEDIARVLRFLLTVTYNSLTPVNPSDSSAGTRPDPGFSLPVTVSLSVTPQQATNPDPDPEPDPELIPFVNITECPIKRCPDGANALRDAIAEEYHELDSINRYEDELRQSFVNDDTASSIATIQRFANAYKTSCNRFLDASIRKLKCVRAGLVDGSIEAVGRDAEIARINEIITKDKQARAIACNKKRKTVKNDVTSDGSSVTFRRLLRRANSKNASDDDTLTADALDSVRDLRDILRDTIRIKNTSARSLNVENIPADDATVPAENLIPNDAQVLERAVNGTSDALGKEQCVLAMIQNFDAIIANEGRAGERRVRDFVRENLGGSRVRKFNNPMLDALENMRRVIRGFDGFGGNFPAGVDESDSFSAEQIADDDLTVAARLKRIISRLRARRLSRRNRARVRRDIERATLELQVANQFKAEIISNIVDAQANLPAPNGASTVDVNP